MVGMGSAGGVLDGGQLLRPLSGWVSSGQLAWVRQALLCLSQQSQDLPPLQAVTAEARLLSWGRSHPEGLLHGEQLTGSCAWAEGSCPTGALQDNLVGVVGGPPPPSPSFLTTHI